MKTFYVTSAIPYANAEPHLGHLFELVGCDVYARAKRMLGYDVFFQTGTDEHGQKMLDTAAKHNMPPKEYADSIAPRFHDLWKDLNISFDRFIRSTDQDHKESVTKFWKAVRDNGDIYLGKYEGWYSVSEESFVLESQAVKNEADGCFYNPENNEKLVWRTEESYFFRWSKYADRLSKWIEEHPEFIAPAFRANEMVNSFLKNGLQDISISRSAIDWGIPVPDDPKHVIYVWFDALINYITGIGYGTNDELFNKWWPCNLHIVGKDILKFHTLLWPAMLMAAGLEPPKRVFGHGWVLLKSSQSDDSGEKMSKSKGNVVKPRELLTVFNGNPDPIRYFLMREMDFGQDGLYSEEALLTRYNSDLVNGIGNLSARSLSMVEKYRQGVITPPATYTDEDKKVIDAVTVLFRKNDKGTTEYEQLLDDGKINELMRRIVENIATVNVYITEQAPYKMAKLPECSERLDTVLYVLCEALRLISAQLYPVIPQTAEIIWQQLSTPKTILETGFDDLAKWGYLPQVTIHRGENLFPKLEQTN